MPCPGARRAAHHARRGGQARSKPDRFRVNHNCHHSPVGQTLRAVTAYIMPNTCINPHRWEGYGFQRSKEICSIEPETGIEIDLRFAIDASSLRSSRIYSILHHPSISQIIKSTIKSFKRFCSNFLRARSLTVRTYTASITTSGFSSTFEFCFISGFIYSFSIGLRSTLTKALSPPFKGLSHLSQMNTRGEEIHKSCQSSIHLEENQTNPNRDIFSFTSSNLSSNHAQQQPSTGTQAPGDELWLDGPRRGVQSKLFLLRYQSGPAARHPRDSVTKRQHGIHGARQSDKAAPVLHGVLCSRPVLYGMGAALARFGSFPSLQVLVASEPIGNPFPGHPVPPAHRLVAVREKLFKGRFQLDRHSFPFAKIFRLTLPFHRELSPR